MTKELMKAIIDAVEALKTTRKSVVDCENKIITAYKIPLQGREMIRIDIKEV
jgi:hypothetical protein